MKAIQTFFYSPFTSKNIKGQEGLLLQFIMKELFLCMEVEPHYVEDPFFTLNPWDREIGPLNRVKEYLKVMPLAFPEMVEERKSLQSVFETKKIKKIFLELEPFIYACRSNETLLHFLLKHERAIRTFTRPAYLKRLLLKMFPKGLGDLELYVARRLNEKGFNYLTKQLSYVLEELEHV